MRILILLLCLLCLDLNAQTVIDYSNVSGTTCLFTTNTNVAATVNGSTNITVVHRVTVGQVDKDATNGAVAFQGISNSSGTLGSEYRIEYDFKQNYTYSIVVSAFSVYNTSAAPTLRLKLTNTTNTTSSCNGYQTIDNNLNGTLISYRSVTTALSNLNFDFQSISSANPYLTIANIPTDNGVQTIEIKKITITETAPAVSLTLPATTNVTCGSSTPVTFAVTNVNGTKNVTDYTWNLGATPNGWLYNGSAAPASVSTGITSSIALIPVCGSVPSNVSATVTADGNTYNTNASAINVMAPDLSIHGTTNVCSSSSYFINNLPSCNASVTWSVSNSNIASLSCTSCNSTTLTKLVDGTVTLTATITNTNACGSGTTVKTMTVNTGIPVLTSATYTYNGSQSPLQYYTGSSSYNPLCTSQNTDVNATFTGANTVTWTKVSSSNTVSWTQSGNDINFYLWGAGQTAVFNVDASNGCGDVSYNFGFQDFDCGGGGGCARYVVSNTNQSSLRVVTPNIPPPCRVAQTKKEKDAINKPVISQIKIYDMSGRLRVRNTFPGVKEALINTHGLTPGVYLIEISDGKTSEKQLVSIIK